MLEHVLNLLLHGDKKENAEVHEQYRPEHRYIYERKKRKEECDEHTACTRVPEFELWQTASKRTILFAFAGGQPAPKTPRFLCGRGKKKTRLLL